MIDLVERLREGCPISAAQKDEQWEWFNKITDEAADELERLDEALKTASAALEQIANESVRNLGSARIVARAAIAKVGADRTATHNA